MGLQRVAIIALPMFNNLKGTYLTTGVEKWVWRQKANKTSVSYAGPILTDSYRIHGLLLTRIEDPGPARLGPHWFAAEDAAGVFSKSFLATA